MQSDIDAEALAVVPKIPNECSDPQCGDSTWDHDCELGGLHDDVELAAIVAAFVRRERVRFAVEELRWFETLMRTEQRFPINWSDGMRCGWGEAQEKYRILIGAQANHLEKKERARADALEKKT